MHALKVFRSPVWLLLHKLSSPHYHYIRKMRRGDRLPLTRTSWCVHVSQACVTWLWSHIDGILTLLNLSQVFVIRSVSPLPYNLGSPHIMVCTVSQACVTWLWSHIDGLLTLLNLSQVFMIKSVSPLPYNLGSPHIMVCTCTCQSGMCHLTLISYWWYTYFIKSDPSFCD